MFLQGTEFHNAKVKNFLKSQSIHLYSTFSRQKSFISEIYIRKFKNIMYKIFTETKRNRWVDHLQAITKTLNKTVHTSHGMRPIDVNKKNQDEAFNNLFGSLAQQPVPEARFHVGDKVRISRAKFTFEKSGTFSWGTEIYEVHEILDTIPLKTYKLKTKGKEEILDGIFYPHELQLVEE